MRGAIPSTPRQAGGVRPPLVEGECCSFFHSSPPRLQTHTKLHLYLPSPRIEPPPPLPLLTRAGVLPPPDNPPSPYSSLSPFIRKQKRSTRSRSRSPWVAMLPGAHCSSPLPCPRPRPLARRPRPPSPRLRICRDGPGDCTSLLLPTFLRASGRRS